MLNVANGTLDLKTRQLRPHRPEDLLTKLAPVRFDPEAVCPRWLAFLDRVLAGNEKVIGFLQRAVGSALTGDAEDQVIFILYGTGANGKSTFLKTIAALLGEYACWAAAETFLVKRSDGPRNDVARLRGARFVASTETEEGAKLAEALVKRLTGDVVTARFLYQEEFEYQPSYKIFLGVNHRPRITGTDHAIWRRIRLVPFTVTIPEEEWDSNLGDTLKTELSRILNWALAGCAAWQAEGLDTPEAVRTATQGYRAAEDVLAAFFEECAVIGPDRSVAAGRFYTAYSGWAKDAGEKPISKKAFGMALGERGFTARQVHARRMWLGVGLRTSDDGGSGGGRLPDETAPHPSRVPRVP